jgi:hypothetical protein
VNVGIGPVGERNAGDPTSPVVEDHVVRQSQRDRHGSKWLRVPFNATWDGRSPSCLHAAAAPQQLPRRRHSQCFVEIVQLGRENGVRS